MKRYKRDPYLPRLLKRVGKPATRAENASLCSAILAGDADAKRRMMESNVPLVVHKVASFIRAYPHAEPYRDDLVAGGILGLTEAVNSLSDDRNPTGYLSTCIKAQIGETFDVLAGTTDQGALDGDTRKRRHRKKRPHLLEIPERGVADVVVDPRDAVELRDSIQAACLDSLDRDLVAAFESGANVSEVCRALGLSQYEVRQRREAIYQRFQASHSD